MAQNGLDIDALLAGNAQAVETIRQYEALLEQISGIPGLEGLVAQYKSGVAQYKSGVLGTAEQVIGLLTANSAAIGGMESYLDGVSAQLPALTEGLGELKTQYEEFDASITQLVNLLGNMTGNLSALAGGINQPRPWRAVSTSWWPAMRSWTLGLAHTPREWLRSWLGTAW